MLSLTRRHNKADNAPQVIISAFVRLGIENDSLYARPVFRLMVTCAYKCSTEEFNLRSFQRLPTGIINTRFNIKLCCIFGSHGRHFILYISSFTLFRRICLPCLKHRCIHTRPTSTSSLISRNSSAWSKRFTRRCNITF